MSYKLALPKNYSRRIWRAIMEFEMLQPGDKVLVGLSGGKDSALLLFALKVLQQQTGYPFELGAVTVDAGFSSESYQDILTELCTALSVPLYYERHPELQEIVFDPQHRQNPCARCAFFRRGIINRIAVKEGYNKIALGHHLDDAVETFLMSILLAGKIETFTPVTSQDRSQVTVIRPLVLLREKEITGAKRFFP
ncbi:MAG: tRNA 2-thiocytidine biosynthesis TtcA family protein, partial [Symbiobacteriaceae bacterium]|nr:tRNA 2-thiocytidine biosynthesis TtcA family protein [Symbiobacteriaceae bacterium]